VVGGGTGAVTAGERSVGVALMGAEAIVTGEFFFLFLVHAHFS